MPHPVPVQCAIDYLQMGLNSSLWPFGSRLPIIRTLAREAGVSTKAMQGAARELAGKGLLTIQNRYGIFAGRRMPSPPKAVRALLRWEAVKQALGRDMLTGVFEDQELLPGVRYLQKHYAVSGKTIRKVIRALGAEGSLVIDNRKSRIVRIKTPTSFTSILFISPGDSVTKVKIYSGKFKDFYQALEGRCIRGEIRLDCCGASVANQNEVFKFLHKNQDYFGYCLYATGLAPGLRDKILGKLILRGRPVAVVDEGDQPKLPQLKYPCTLFSTAAFLAGRQVGQFLQELGHNHIAFVSLHHETLWSQKRYAGLVQAFSETGAHDGVKLVAIPEIAAASVMDDPAIVRAIGKITGINSDFPLQKGVPVIEEYAQIIPGIRGLLYLHGQFPLAWKHFEDLFKDSSITAVVGSQDLTAVLAHEYLKQKGVAVPKKISLCGFDNHEMAIEDDLTSYHFLFSNIAADVIAYIINPSAQVFKGRREIECPGAIIQRSTTGSAQ
jgi:DNA-binding LacI/PurR family transcriptional regulator